MTQPAQQPPAGPPPQPTTPPAGQAGQQPPPAAPPAPPAPTPPQPTAVPPQPAPAYPYGIQPPIPPQQQPPPTPPGWPQPPAPGQPPTPPYPQQYPTPPAPTGQPPSPPTPQPPAPGDDGQGGYDLSRLPKGARDEIERLRSQVAQRDTQLRTTAVSQQAWQVAPQMGVNPQALLGSTAWQQAAAQLDPAAPDYTQRLAWTIQGIAAQNPWMANQPAGNPPTPPQPPAPPPTSGADFSGAGGNGQPITEAQLAQMTPEQIAKAFEEGKLKHLM